MVEPATPLLWGWHLDAMCEHLEAQTRGQIRDLVINVPPRTSKSTVVSVMWPAWEWTFNPAQRWLCASYTDSLALDLGLSMRRVIGSDWYRGLWGGQVELSKDKQTEHRFDTTAYGYRISTSFGGTVLGKGGGRIVIDDPHNTKGAESDAQRESALETWRSVFANRGNDPKRFTRTVVMQRLHKQDLSGYLLESGGWEHLMLPMEFESVRRCRTGIGWSDPRRADGELLQPARFGPKEIAERKKAGSYVYAGQEQQRPAPLEGGLFKRGHWKRWRSTHAVPISGRETKMLPVALERLVLSVDCSFKDLETSDYVVILLLGAQGPDKFMLRLRRARMGLYDTLTAIRDEVNAARVYGYLQAIVVEDKANGTAVIETLKKEFPAVIPINPEGGKFARAVAVQPQQEGGNYFLPDPTVPGSEWVGDFIEELADFPNADFDDQVDALSQGVRYLDGEGAVTDVLRMAMGAG